MTQGMLWGHLLLSWAKIPIIKKFVTGVGSTTAPMRRYTDWLPTALAGVWPIPVSAGVLPGRKTSESIRMPTIKYCNGFYKNTVFRFVVLSVWQTVPNDLLFRKKFGVSVVENPLGRDVVLSKISSSHFVL